MKRVMLVSSVGGHLEQLLSLKITEKKYETYIVTEENEMTKKLKGNKHNMFLLPYISRNFFFAFLLNYLKCFLLSFRLFLKVRPEVIISTGAGCTLPMCLIGKLMGSKIIFIETFARINTKTATGKICYYFADVFIVQWEGLKKIYPKAIYLGHIY